MSSSDVERVRSVEHRFAVAQATDVVHLPWGFALLRHDFPASHFHNRVIVTAPVAAAAVVATTDEILGGAALPHRYVTVVDDALGMTLADDLPSAGYEHETIVAMVYAGAVIERPENEVREVSLAEIRPALIKDWRMLLPDVSDTEVDQLADRTALYSKGAEVTLLAIYDSGEIIAHADLYVDRMECVAQFENLVTHEEFRSRGLGATLVREALWRAQQSGCELTFLTADLADWPYHWYRRLGFIEAYRSHNFTRVVGT